MANIEVEYQSSVNSWDMGMHGGMGTEMYKTNELKQFLIDFSDGTIYDYSIKNIAHLIHRDINIYNEFNALRKRQKRKNSFVYIKKYNDAHPWYILKKIE